MFKKEGRDKGNVEEKSLRMKYIRSKNIKVSNC